jgi:hypothetical protein
LVQNGEVKDVGEVLSTGVKKKGMGEDVGCVPSTQGLFMARLFFNTLSKSHHAVLLQKSL